MNLIGLAYLPLVTRVGFFFLHDDFFGLRQINRVIGRLELGLGWLRDYVAIPVTLYLFGARVLGGLQWGLGFSFPIEIIFLALSLYARWWRWHGLAPLQELARKHPRIHPSEFFEHLYGRLGFLPHRVPEKPKRVIDPDHLDFRTNKGPKKSFFLLLRGIYDTFIFATLAYKCFRWKRANYIRTAGSGLSVVWAARLAQDARMEVIVERSPKLEAASEVSGGKPFDPIQGRQIFAINHKSFFDFCLAPLAYRKEQKDGSAASFIPAIMVAKDHFKDNFFLYRVVGFGKMLEAWGMVFVERRAKKEGQAKQAVTATVKKLLSTRIPFSIYPQGTRAWGQLDRGGSRWDAGYFCVGRGARLKREGGHFKKGVGYIAVELALSLLKHKFHDKVWLIPVAMDGPGTTCPKKSLRVQTETTVHLKVGDPIGLDPMELVSLKNFTYQEAATQPLYQQKVLECCEKIDRSLQQMLNIPKRLERRFFTDLRERIDPRGMDEVAVGMKQFRNEGTHLYAILDCIYALPRKYWPALLMELANVLRTHDSIDALVALREKVAAYF